MKKGFTLIELLAVIVILAIIALIATPIILGVVENARKSAAGSSALGYLDAVEKAIALDGLDNIVYPTGDIDILTAEHYKDIEVQGEGPSKGSLVVSDRYLIERAVLCVNNYKVELTGHKIDKITKDGCDDLTRVPYKEGILNGTDPVLAGELVPVTIDDKGVVKKADIYKEWYKYAEQRWANAVLLTGPDSKEPGEVINEDEIDAYFVWIPKFRYQLWRVAEEETSAHSISIKFGTEDTVDNDTECKTPMESGKVGHCAKDKWMTHPAFISLGVTGFWTSKYSVGYRGAIDSSSIPESNDSTKIIVKPNVYAWMEKLKNAFEASYNYKRSLDSHLMKNTEWGAIAILSYSNYGINKRIRQTGCYINYTYAECTSCGKTGMSPIDELTACTLLENGASTSGNKTGVFDMNDSMYRSTTVAEYSDGNYDVFSEEEVKNYARYLDKYNELSFVKSSVDSNYCILKGHILGDATGELGKFECNTPEYNDWRFGMWLSVEIGTPGLSTRGSVGGQFSYNMHPITSTLAGYFMVVLSPQQ